MRKPFPPVPEGAPGIRIDPKWENEPQMNADKR